MGCISRHSQGHRLRREPWGLQQRTPLGRRKSGRSGGDHVRRLEALAQLQPLGEQPVLAVGQLQPLGHGQGVGGPSQKRGRQGHLQTLGPVQTPSPAGIGLQLRIHQRQATPDL